MLYLSQTYLLTYSIIILLYGNVGTYLIYINYMMCNTFVRVSNFSQRYTNKTCKFKPILQSLNTIKVC